MNSLRLAFLLTLLALPFFLTGCQSWTRGGNHTSALGFSLHTPSDWIYHPSMGGDFLATKDGVLLQSLTVHRQPLATPLPHNKRALTASLTPFELAEALVDDLKADRQLHRLVVVENTPAKLGGKDAVRLVVDYHLEDDFHLTRAHYACIHGDYLYLVSLQAPARHYFPAARPALDDVVRSFAFTDAGQTLNN